jgi:hypothetical protein
MHKTEGDHACLPPGPWSIEVTARKGEHIGSGHVYLVDAKGRKIASIWGTPDEKIAVIDFILAAKEREDGKK